MGQKSCCESNANRKNIINESESNTQVSGASNTDSNKDPSLINQTPSNSNFGQNSVNNLVNSVNSVNSLKSNNSVINQNFQCIKSFEAHNDKIVSLIELNSGYIATGSYDNTIKVWDIMNQKSFV